jgi:phosphate-selective porin OprO/OprP
LVGRFFVNDKNDALTNQFTFRRARINFEGTVFKYFDFRVLPDFAGSQVILFDAYVDANFISEAKLRVGKFKPPVGLERLQSATALSFIERAQPTNLVPNRDFGVQLFGDLLNGALGYQLAILNGAPDGSNPAVGDVNDDKDFAGRIFALPFKDLSIDPLKGLGVGFAGSFGRQRGNATTPDVPTFKTFGQATFFQYSGAVAATMTAPARGPTIAFGQRDRWSPQAYYYVGPFGLLAEYVNSTQTVRRDNASGRISNDAWQVSASYLLTGENATYKLVNPAQPFDPFSNKWGAWQVAARYGQLHVDSDAFTGGFASASTSARRDKEWVVGVNWYLNKNIAWIFNYAHSDFSGGFGTGDRPSESALETRVQLVL